MVGFILDLDEIKIRERKRKEVDDKGFQLDELREKYHKLIINKRIELKNQIKNKFIEYFKEQDFEIQQKKEPIEIIEAVFYKKRIKLSLDVPEAEIFDIDDEVYAIEEIKKMFDDDRLLHLWGLIEKGKIDNRRMVSIKDMDDVVSFIQEQILYYTDIINNNDKLKFRYKHHISYDNETEYFSSINDILKMMFKTK